MFRVAVAGHVCVDLTPQLSATAEIRPGHLVDVGSLAIAPGGCVSNTGGALADLGAQVTISSSIGDDHLGSVLRDLLQQRGVDSRGVLVEQDASTSYSIVIEKPGENRSFWHHVGANADFDGSKVVLDGSDVLHVGYPPLLPALSAGDGHHLVNLFSRARSLGVTTSLDMAVVDPQSAAGAVDWSRFLAAVLPLTDVFSPSIDDLTSALRMDPTIVDPAELSQDLVKLGAGIVMLSLGEHGMLLSAAGTDRLMHGGAIVSPLASAWADARVSAPPVPVERIVTTNGAGDAASAGLLLALSLGMDPARALSAAATVAAARVQGISLTAATLS